MQDFTPLQRRVFNAAKAKLEKKPWFTGVCTDDFPTDVDIQKDFEGSVTQVMMLTAYWDAPGSGLGEI